MQFNSLLRVMGSLALVCAFASDRAAAQLDQLILKVPDTANAVAVINASALHAHIDAVEEDWEGAGLTVPLEGVEWYLQAAEMDYEFMQPQWEISVASLPAAPTMEQVAASSGGRLDRLAGSSTVERPNDSYVVGFGPKVLAAMSPANRQNVARWIREAKTRKSPALSPYLLRALDGAQAGPAEIVLAFDLEGVFAPEEASAALAKSAALKAAAIDPNQAATLLSGMVGVRLDIDWDDDFRGVLVMEFSEQPDLLMKAAQPLLMEVLAKRGANVDAFSQWKVRGDGKSIAFEGPLPASALRRVASILSRPTGPISAPATSQSPPTVSAETVTGEASRKYFQAVTGYLDDLFGGNIQPQSLYQVQVWVDRYARQIQELNTQNVDRDLVNYGSNVVMLLGEVGSSARRSQMRSDLREATIDGPGSYRYGRYGTYGYYEKGYVARDIAVAQADEASQAVGATAQIVDQLHQISNQTRAEMTQRYGIKF